VIQTKARPRSRGPVGAAFPVIVRPSGVPRASAPADIPEPEHHHLPAWVRRAHAKAGPILADLAGSLEGDARTEFLRSVSDLTARISSGKFSQAFQYPQLIEAGLAMVQEQHKEQEEAQRARRALDNARRSVGDLLRDAGPRLTPEASARLNRALRSATDESEIDAVASEVRGGVDSAKVVEERRRDREITRTRSRIERSSPKNGAPAADPTETWQDVLRRLQEQMVEEEQAASP